MIAYGNTLYRRYSKRKRSHVYSAQFKDGKTGKRLPGRSTGHTSKAQAVLQEPKCASARIVPMPKNVQRLLRKIIDESHGPEFLFQLLE